MGFSSDNYDATIISFSFNPGSTVNPVSTSLYLPSSNILPQLNWNNNSSRYNWQTRWNNSLDTQNKQDDRLHEINKDDKSPERSKPSTLIQFLRFILAFLKSYPHLLLLLTGWILWRMLYLEKRYRRRDVVDMALEQRFDWNWVRRNLTIKDL